MSSLLRVLRPTTGMAMTPTVMRPLPLTFSTQAARALKETDRDHPDLGSKYEAHKQEQLKKQKEGKREWKAELASSSEEAVAADRGENIDHSEEGLRELQRKTAGYAEEKHK